MSAMKSPSSPRLMETEFFIPTELLVGELRNQDLTMLCYCTKTPLDGNLRGAVVSSLWSLKPFIFIPVSLFNEHVKNSSYSILILHSDLQLLLYPTAM